MVNHFPNHWELTRKDAMVKNIKRYMRDVKAEACAGSSSSEVMSTATAKAAATGAGDYSYRDGYLPLSYTLPTDYALFVEEFKRCGGGTWIMKPFNAVTDNNCTSQFRQLCSCLGALIVSLFRIPMCRVRMPCILATGPGAGHLPREQAEPAQ
jgi:tubulin polyglutamylase TTLL1